MGSASNLAEEDVNAVGVAAGNSEKAMERRRGSKEGSARRARQAVRYSAR
jgi:hypothetical protein